VTASTAVVHALIVLSVAAACALLAIFAPPFARLLLRGIRAEVEVRQYAESLFLARSLFATRRRTGLLVLVSLFERRVEIVADSGFTGRVSAAEWTDVIARMTPHLRGRRPVEAVKEALAAIDALLAAKGFRGDGDAANELPDSPIQERGQ
jgi:putative membrane protein